MPQRSGPFRGFRRTTPVGAVPGTLHRPPEPVSAACRITRIEWSHDFIHEEVIDTFEELNELVPADRRYWFRVEGTLDVETVRRLGETFDLHPLALEDVLNTHQRCKVEEYPEVLFLVTRLPVYEADGQLATEQVSMFLGDGFLVTLHEGRAPVLNPVRDRLLHARGRIREFGADYLAYAVLDTVIDNFFPVLERLGERLNQVDDSLETGSHVDTRTELRHVRA
ncbi:MAG: CorA family divalent cation transporter, partial [Planctomycetaceae bacterium]